MGVIIATGFAELPDDVSMITRLRKPYSQDDLAEALARSRRSARINGAIRSTSRRCDCPKSLERRAPGHMST